MQLGPSMDQVSRGPDDTNNSHEQLKNKQGIWCHTIRKDKIINCNIANQTQANTLDPATHLEDAQHMGRDVGNVSRWTTLGQSVENKT